MEFTSTLWDLFQKRSFSRRSFLKTCVALTGMMGLAPSMMPEVVVAAERKPLPLVIWLHGHECTGCDEAFIRAQKPLASDIVLNLVALEDMEVLGAAAGEALERHHDEIVAKYPGKYLLLFEGAVPLGDDGISCVVGGKPIVEKLRATAAGAAAIIEVGTCAAWGGIQTAKPNPTRSVAVSDVIKGKTIIKVPGCPPMPETIAGTIYHVALFGVPPLDSHGRPKMFFGNRIHDTCYRRAFFDSGMFVETFDDMGSKAGWCLYKVGCRGPVAYNSCGNLRWWNGLSYPIQAGSPCVACAANDFWDNDPFHQRLPNIPLPNTIANADKVGAVAAGATLAGVVAHGLLSVAQHRWHRDQEGNENRE
ncbi:hydrogenase (NiFe) small subunit HydA [Thermosinus carboxydivorans Nor1]|uniref:Hydrogenase (NiFe) small subunit HydA n=1 Tax=Thermosinus carboxydivorans Nor1 TaxID=401526 RepID=A1HUI2_9FIRM|nr:hydrogenase small subunit [Thermosinus carboxydivorans]EAX46313.1 hydrogenase (NiFe) small subunit HydA [Thermosinus carboxydivorans Nor1]